MGHALDFSSDVVEEIVWFAGVESNCKSTKNAVHLPKDGGSRWANHVKDPGLVSVNS